MALFKKPRGLSIEIGCANIDGKRKWFIYIGPQKLRHIRPTYDPNSFKRFYFGYGISDYSKWENAYHGGIKFDISIGTMRRPVPCFWKKEFRSTEYMIREPVTNPWNSGNHWFILTFPLFIFPFFMIGYGAGKRQPGIYIGSKTYEVNKISQALGKYDVGNPKVYLEKEPYPQITAWGHGSERGNLYMCLSASLRDDIVDG